MKKVFCLLIFFRNISKTAETILVKKIGRNHGISVYKKALISKHRKNYIFRDINYFVKMSVSLYATNFCGWASSKTSVNIKTKFPTYFWSIEINSWLDFGAYRPKCTKLNQKCMVKSSGWPHQNVSIFFF